MNLGHRGYGSSNIWKYGDWGIWECEKLEIWEFGNWGIGVFGEFGESGGL